MRYVIASLFALLISAPALSATEKGAAEAFVPEVVPTVTAQSAPSAAATMQLNEIAIEERSTSSEAAAAQLGPRGSFWWIVGVIVVAGIILAVVL